MTDVPWTPGPWFVQPRFLTIYNMSGGTSGLTCAVASVLTEHPGMDQANANARLIAEAPAMAHQLAGILDAYESNGLGGDFGDGVSTDAIRAILARIKGEA